MALFVFILVANWFSVLGIGSEIEWIGPPTSDINMTLALAFIVIVPVHIASIRNRGLVGYVKHYVSQPFPKPLFLVNIFINGVEEIAKPLTLALRLFGNLLSGGLMLALIAALGVWTISTCRSATWPPWSSIPIWKIFDLAIGAIQAFIFALLTILYFDTAMSDAHCGPPSWTPPASPNTAITDLPTTTDQKEHHQCQIQGSTTRSASPAPWSVAAC